MTLADRLGSARHGLFVGRQRECADVREWLDAAEPTCNVLFISGPGGIGKTTLLAEFAWLCRESGVKARLLDGSRLDATPVAWASAVHEDGDFEVLLVDGYEQLQPIDRWVVEHFLPTLRARTLLVLASRQPPSAVWQLDAAVQLVTRHRPLENFSTEESHRYLERRGVPVAQRDGILAFTLGHPLAIALATESVLQRGRALWQAGPDPNLIKTLLDHFVQDVPTPTHYQALEACSVVHRLTEGLLAAMLPEAEARELFDWLRRLSFIEARPDGLMPHDIVRQVLTSELRWRHPDWLHELHRRARQAYHARIGQRLSPSDVFDLVYLHRDNPMVRPFLDWKLASDFLVDAYRPTDEADLLAMVRLHEGETAAQHLAYWLSIQPEQVQVVRNSDGVVQGFLLQLALHSLTPEQVARDPLTARVYRFLQDEAPLRGREEGLYCRFWMDARAHQSVSAVQSRIFLTFVLQALSMPQLAFSALTVANAGFWAPAFAYAEARRLDGAGDGWAGTYYFDWRRLPSYAWLELLAERETHPAPLQRPSAAPASVLSQEQFNGAVREALKVVLNQDSLAANPLARARFVLDHVGVQAGDAARATYLQEVMRQALDSLQSTPRDAKLYRALLGTYFEPAESQELAAQRLDVPFSTYRRHLTAGLARLQEILWQRELRR